MAKSAPNSFRLLMASNLFFLLASILYCISSGLQLQNINNKDETIESGDSRGLLFAGAFCFVIVGAFDYYNHRPRTWLHLTLIFAGVFGCISAVAEPKSNTSVAFNWASTHFYLLEALQLLYRNVKKRKDESQTIRGLRLVADVEFFLGAVLDICLSYVHIARKDEETSITAMKTDLVSCMFWLIAALLTNALCLYVGKDGVKVPKEETATMSLAMNGGETTTGSFQADMT